MMLLADRRRALRSRGAAVLLLGVGLVPWLQLVFPGWVFTLSVHILIVTFRSDAVSVPVAEHR